MNSSLTVKFYLLCILGSLLWGHRKLLEQKEGHLAAAVPAQTSQLEIDQGVHRNTLGRSCAEEPRISYPSPGGFTWLEGLQE